MAEETPNKPNKQAEAETPEAKPGPDPVKRWTRILLIVAAALLVWYLRADRVNQEMVTAMIKLARTMQFRIVAEEVEHQDDFDWLRDVGVDFVQGHFVDPPAALGTTASTSQRFLNT